MVDATANLDLAAKAVLWAGISNAGASCLSIERVYVEARTLSMNPDHVANRNLNPTANLKPTFTRNPKACTALLPSPLESYTT